MDLPNSTPMARSSLQELGVDDLAGRVSEVSISKPQHKRNQETGTPASAARPQGRRRVDDAAGEKENDCLDDEVTPTRPLILSEMLAPKHGAQLEMSQVQRFSPHRGLTQYDHLPCSCHINADFQLKINTALWNTIQLLFISAKSEPLTPPAASKASGPFAGAPNNGANALRPPPAGLTRIPPSFSFRPPSAANPGPAAQQQQPSQLLQLLGRLSSSNPNPPNLLASSTAASGIHSSGLPSGAHLVQQTALNLPLPSASSVYSARPGDPFGMLHPNVGGGITFQPFHPASANLGLGVYADEAPHRRSESGASMPGEVGLGGGRTRGAHVGPGGRPPRRTASGLDQNHHGLAVPDSSNSVDPNPFMRTLRPIHTRTRPSESADNAEPTASGPNSRSRACPFLMTSRVSQQPARPRQHPSVSSQPRLQDQEEFRPNVFLPDATLPTMVDEARGALPYSAPLDSVSPIPNPLPYLPSVPSFASMIPSSHQQPIPVPQPGLSPVMSTESLRRIRTQQNPQRSDQQLRQVTVGDTSSSEEEDNSATPDFTSRIADDGAWSSVDSPLYRMASVSRQHRFSASGIPSASLLSRTSVTSGTPRIAAEAEEGSESASMECSEALSPFTEGGYTTTPQPPSRASVGMVAATYGRSGGLIRSGGDTAAMFHTPSGPQHVPQDSDSDQDGSYRSTPVPGADLFTNSPFFDADISPSLPRVTPDTDPNVGSSTQELPSTDYSTLFGVMSDSRVIDEPPTALTSACDLSAFIQHSGVVAETPPRSPRLSRINSPLDVIACTPSPAPLQPPSSSTVPGSVPLTFSHEYIPTQRVMDSPSMLSVDEDVDAGRDRADLSADDAAISHSSASFEDALIHSQSVPVMTGVIAAAASAGYGKAKHHMVVASPINLVSDDEETDDAPPLGSGAGAGGFVGPSLSNQVSGPDIAPAEASDSAPPARRTRSARTSAPAGGWVVPGIRRPKK
eukprot:gene32234-16798_t